MTTSSFRQIKKTIGKFAIRPVTNDARADRSFSTLYRARKNTKSPMVVVASVAAAAASVRNNSRKRPLHSRCGWRASSVARAPLAGGGGERRVNARLPVLAARPRKRAQWTAVNGRGSTRAALSVSLSLSLAFQLSSARTKLKILGVATMQGPSSRPKRHRPTRSGP